MSYVSFFFLASFTQKNCSVIQPLSFFQQFVPCSEGLPLQTEEIAQRIESSLCKHEDLSLSPHPPRGLMVEA